MLNSCQSCFWGNVAATATINRQPNPLLRGSFPRLAFLLFSSYTAFTEVVPFMGKLRPQLILAILGLLAVFGAGQFMKERQ